MTQLLRGRRLAEHAVWCALVLGEVPGCFQGSTVFVRHLVFHRIWVIGDSIEVVAKLESTSGGVTEEPRYGLFQPHSIGVLDREPTAYFPGVIEEFVYGAAHKVAKRRSCCMWVGASRQRVATLHLLEGLPALEGAGTRKKRTKRWCLPYVSSCGSSVSPRVASLMTKSIGGRRRGEAHLLRHPPCSHHLS